MKKLFVPLLVILFLLVINPSYGSVQIKKQVVKIENKSKQGYLGVELQDVTKKLKEKKNLAVDKGAYIQNVVEDSPAEEAGIEKGDVIVKFGDEVIDDSEDLTEAVHKTKPKTEVKVEINRKGEKETLTAKIGKSKTPQVFSYNFNDDGFKPYLNDLKIPKLPRSLNLKVFTESEVNGIHVQTLTKQLGEYFGAPKGRGLLITEVEKESGAEKAGFKAGDVITKIDDRTVDKVEKMHEIISDFDGKEIPFEIIRNGKSMKISMTVESEKEDEDDWSGNIMIAPHAGHSKTFRLETNPKSFDLEKLRERLFDLREEIRRGIGNIKRTIERQFLES